MYIHTYVQKSRQNWSKWILPWKSENRNFSRLQYFLYCAYKEVKICVPLLVNNNYNNVTELLPRNILT